MALFNRGKKLSLREMMLAREPEKQAEKDKNKYGRWKSSSALEHSWSRGLLVSKTPAGGDLHENAEDDLRLHTRSVSELKRFDDLSRLDISFGFGHKNRMGLEIGQRASCAPDVGVPRFAHSTPMDKIRPAQTPTLKHATTSQTMTKSTQFGPIARQADCYPASTRGGEDDNEISFSLVLEEDELPSPILGDSSAFLNISGAEIDHSFCAPASRKGPSTTSTRSRPPPVSSSNGASSSSCSGVGCSSSKKILTSTSSNSWSSSPFRTRVMTFLNDDGALSTKRDDEEDNKHTGRARTTIGRVEKSSCKGVESFLGQASRKNITKNMQKNKLYILPREQELDHDGHSLPVVHEDEIDGVQFLFHRRDLVADEFQNNHEDEEETKTMLVEVEDNEARKAKKKKLNVLQQNHGKAGDRDGVSGAHEDEQREAIDARLSQKSTKLLRGQPLPPLLQKKPSQQHNPLMNGRSSSSSAGSSVDAKQASDRREAHRVYMKKWRTANPRSSWTEKKLTKVQKQEKKASNTYRMCKKKAKAAAKKQAKPAGKKK